MSCNGCSNPGCTDCCDPLTVPALPIEAVPTCTPCGATESSTCDALSLGHPFEKISNLVFPATGSSVSVSVKDSCHWLVGTCVVVSDGASTGILQVTSIDSSANTVSLTNQGYAANATLGGTTLTNPNVWFRGECPSGTGSTDANCFDTSLLTSEAFTVPSTGATNDLYLDECVDIEAGQRAFVEGLGLVEVVSITSNDPVGVLEVQTVCLLPGVTAGNTIGSGAFVVPVEYCIPVDPEGGIIGTGSSGDPLLVQQPSFLLGFNGPTQTLTTITQNYDPDSPPTNLVGGGDASPIEITMDVAVHDNASGADLANDGYIIPEAGEWFLQGTAQIDEGSPAGDYLLAFGINDTHVLPVVGTQASLPTTAVTDIKLHSQINFRLAENDVVKLYVFHSTGAGVVQSAAVDVESAYLGGFKLNK